MYVRDKMTTFQTDTLDIDISSLLNKFKAGKLSAEELEKAILKSQKQGSGKNWKDSLQVLGNLSLAYTGVSQVVGQLTAKAKKYTFPS